MGRRKPSFLSLTDLFCGAGGASIGAVAAACRIGPADQRPLWTQPATAQTGVVAPPLIYVGRARNRSRPASEPLPTFSTGGNMGLVAPTNGNRHGDGGERVRSVGEPLSTQTADLYRALITSYYGREDASRPIDEPMGTVTGDPRHAFLSAYNGTAVNRDVAEPMPTCTTVDRHALVEGPAIAVKDCFFRMLLPREIGLGMAFPGSYRVEAPKQKWVVRMYGLAVTPPVATWIWRRVIESLR
jgi:DNA (cytosine-5)-methyltransferase 1